MKHVILLTTLIVAFTIWTNGQNTVPNTDFEQWTSGKPDGWDATNFNIMTIVINTVNIDSIDPQHGSRAVKINTTEENIFSTLVTVPGLITLGKFEIDLVNFTGSVSGGAPFTGRPEKLTGYVEAKPAGNDRAFIAVGVSKWNGTKSDTIGLGTLFIDSVQTGWHYFECPITYTTPDQPDSINIIFCASNILQQSFTDGSRLRVDNISLDYGNIVVKENFNNNHFKVWADEHKNLFYDISSLPGDATILQVFTISGLEVERISINDNNKQGQLTLSGLSPGIYLIGIQSASGEVHTRRIILK
jgi:hypothetical protein